DVQQMRSGPLASRVAVRPKVPCALRILDNASITDKYRSCRIDSSRIPGSLGSHSTYDPRERKGAKIARLSLVVQADEVLTRENRQTGERDARRWTRRHGRGCRLATARQHDRNRAPGEYTHAPSHLRPCYVHCGQSANGRTGK